MKLVVTKYMVDITVIVPAYNVEKYIGKCLDSLINQTKKEFEIIVVNDGSKDKTLEIVNMYKSKNQEKIRILTQQNQGLSAARNNGIKMAEGKYVMFVDSDDEIDVNLLEKLWNKIEEFQYDVVAFDVKLIYPKKSVVIKSGITENITQLNEEDRKKIITNMYCMACNKIYKKDIFNDINMLFEPNLWFEDVLFLHKLIPNLKSFGFIEFPGYMYYQRKNSITYTYTDRLVNIQVVMDKIIEYYEKQDYYDIYKDELEYMYARYMFATYIKRLAKGKDKKRFDAGVKFAQECVNKKFPQYKKNKYINNKRLKSLYLKNFNSLVANIVFVLEKNRMN